VHSWTKLLGTLLWAYSPAFAWACSWAWRSCKFEAHGRAWNCGATQELQAHKAQHHPQCQFCKTHFYSNDELYTHVSVRADVCACVSVCVSCGCVIAAV